ncbi:MAG: alpha-galactosidase [Clostridiaceae bacterium]
MDCYFKSTNNEYVIGNRFIERCWKYDGKGLRTRYIKDKIAGSLWRHGAFELPEVYYEGLTCSSRQKELPYDMELLGVKAGEVENSVFCGKYLDVAFHFADRLHGVDIRRHAIVYEDAPVVRTYVEVKSYNLPMGYFFDGYKYNILDAYPVSDAGCDVRAYEFFTRTDHTNHLVEEHLKPRGFERGNLVFYTQSEGKGVFVLKESPCFTDQRLECEGNFFLDEKGLQVLGWGIRHEEIPAHEYAVTYASVAGVYAGGFEYGLKSLKDYQRVKAKIVPERDYVVMANPWGDRQCMEHMGEDFVLREIEACKKLGATHYQLDDGWQKGNGLFHLSNNEAVDDSYWDIDQARFPEGFADAAQKAKECGVELALWFAPDFNRLFRNHEYQAGLLYGMYRKYGIRKFKIDAVKLRNKEAEDNLEKLLKGLREKTGGDITFNLDTTADARAGYFMFQEYGNIFLENRYTDWHNYYPWLTLKNLWDLCRFVPPQKLQIEFLNIDRNADIYAAGDVLAPSGYSYEYVFAVTMFANPLCWFEPSAMSDKAKVRYRKMIDLHKRHRDGIFAGHILPIGNRPDGYSWTGFQSHNHNDGSGYIIVYRENNPGDCFSFRLFFMEGKALRLQSLTDDSGELKVERYGEGGFEVELDCTNSFRMYRYTSEESI